MKSKKKEISKKIKSQKNEISKKKKKKMKSKKFQNSINVSVRQCQSQIMSVSR